MQAQQPLTPGRSIMQPQQPLTPGRSIMQPQQPLTPGRSIMQPQQPLTPGRAIMQPQQPQIMQNFLTAQQPQMTHAPGSGRPVYVQHLPQPQMSQNFAQSFQQQTGRTLQYVTSIPTMPMQSMQFGTALPAAAFGMSQYQMTAQAAHAATALSQGTLPQVPQVHFQSQNMSYIQAATPQGFIINQPTVSFTYRISSYSFRGNYFLKIWKLQEIQIVTANFNFLPNKLNFCCGNYEKYGT